MVRTIAHLISLTFVSMISLLLRIQVSPGTGKGVSDGKLQDDRFYISYCLGIQVTQGKDAVVLSQSTMCVKGFERIWNARLQSNQDSYSSRSGQ